MPEDKQQHSSDIPENDDESATLHTCACGEQHRHRPGSLSHRDDCTSPKKFGDSCCCGSGAAAQGNKHRCGHGPRCQWPGSKLSFLYGVVTTFRDYDQSPEDCWTAQRLYGCRRSAGAVDYSPGIPHLFSFATKMFKGHCRVFSADIPEPDIWRPVSGNQDRAGEGSCQSVPVR